MLREELWVRRVRLEGSSAAPVPASITLAAGMAVKTGYEMTYPRAREKMCAVNVSVEAVIASGPETLRSSQVGDAAATAAPAAGREARARAGPGCGVPCRETVRDPVRTDQTWCYPVRIGKPPRGGFRANPVGVGEDALPNLNRTVLARVFWGEQACLSSTMVNKQFVLRLCIVNDHTTWDDVLETFEAVERLAMESSE